VIDFARVFPPEFSNINNEFLTKPPTSLYYLLRPEFVKNYSEPLNPDAGTRYEYFNREVVYF